MCVFIAPIGEGGSAASLMGAAGHALGMTEVRNPHAGQPFTDDDAAIAAALEDVSIPALLCSLVHITGDMSWVRGDARPQGAFLNEYQGFMPAEMQAAVRARALPAIAEYRDRGCLPAQAPTETELHEMMSFLAAAEVDPAVVPMFLEDLHIDGADAGEITWGNDFTTEQRDAFPVIVIGCGEAGLLAGIRLQQAGLPFTIIEKSAGPGGTWWDNRYPGARVDIGSHFYCYSFKPADHWTEFFSQHPELRSYFKSVMDDYGIEPNIRFNTEVMSAVYDDATTTWAVEVRNADGTTETLAAKAVISAVGSLNQPMIPELPGMSDFQGPMFHSARWPDGLDIHGKRFALIGAGASGFQIGPTIAPEVATLTVYQRTAQWMMPNANYHEPVPDGERWAMRHLPFYARWFRFLTFYPGAGLNLEGSRIDPEVDDGMTINSTSAMRLQFIGDWMKSQVGDDPELLEKIWPDYPVSAKRMLQDNGSWLASLKRDNVELVRTQIDRIVADGVITVDGEHRPADIICLATGFRNTDYLVPMHIVGRNGTVLREQFGDEPTAYLGITVPNFPNLFCVYGPGTNLAQGASLIFQSECQVNYIMDVIHEMLRRQAPSAEVRQDVHDDYAARYTAEIGQMVWSHPSVKHSHFKNKAGKVFTLSPWPIPTYWQWTKNFNPSDYNFT